LNKERRYAIYEVFEYQKSLMLNDEAASLEDTPADLADRMTSNHIVIPHNVTLNNVRLNLFQA
jgi:hypothetical protein